MENKELRKLMQEKFDSFEPEPSRNLWPEIEEAIEPRGRRAVVWPYWTAAAAVLTLLFSIGWFLLNDHVEENGIPGFTQVDSLPVQVPTKLIDDKPVEALTSTPEVELKENAIGKESKNQVAVSKETPQGQIPQQEIAFTPTPAIASAKPLKQLEVTRISGNEVPAIPELKWELLADLELKLLPTIVPAKLLQERGVKKEFEIGELAPHVLTAFTTHRLDKIGLRSVTEEKNQNGKVRTVKFGFKTFNITRKRHKQYTIKKPDA